MWCARCCWRLAAAVVVRLRERVVGVLCRVGSLVRAMGVVLKRLLSCWILLVVLMGAGWRMLVLVRCLIVRCWWVCIIGWLGGVCGLRCLVCSAGVMVMLIGCGVIGVWIGGRVWS